MVLIVGVFFLQGLQYHLFAVVSRREKAAATVLRGVEWFYLGELT